jgi:uncharacterized protein
LSNNSNGGNAGLSGTGITGITEADIANYLTQTPGFFERQAELLASIQLTSPHGHRAVSLQERQMEMLRERIKGLEMKIVEMIRAGQENMALTDRLQRFMRAILRTGDAAALPAVMAATLKHEFMIPQASLRLWGMSLSPEQLTTLGPAAAAVSEDVKSFAASLTVPYCGVNAGFEAAEWLEDEERMLSLAMIPLRQGDNAFGLLVLGSPDATRYSAEMGTEFLQRVGELVSAALVRLRTGG